jgi:hypothetical protein
MQHFATQFDENTVNLACIHAGKQGKRIVRRSLAANVCAGMRVAVLFPDVRAVHVRVDLRRGDIGMPEKLLDDAQVGATL